LTTEHLIKIVQFSVDIPLMTMLVLSHFMPH